MKKLTHKERERSVRRTIADRFRFKKSKAHALFHSGQKIRVPFNAEIMRLIGSGINAEIKGKTRLLVTLPEIMNFSSNYEQTISYINFIRKLTSENKSFYKYRLGKVGFSGLKKISTSAALVLTAELSKWDDAIRNTLVPSTGEWDLEILKRFTQLGFFELFNRKPVSPLPSITERDIQVVKYIKGRCGDKNKVKELKSSIADIVGDKVRKWTFLDSGLSEAITNVTHHAYPKKFGYLDEDKNWYLTGAYNKSDRELKIVFYDQGIGIPKSLPASEIWEIVARLLDKLPLGTKFQDEVMLKAAVELDRTSTRETDRGKGLQDLLEFIKHRGTGYLSILSGHALYKYSLESGNDRVKSERFTNPVEGTLIIWKVILDD